MPTKTKSQKAREELKRIKRGEMLKTVLLGMGALGILSAAIICPNILMLVPRSYRGRYPHQATRQALLRLDKQGFIVARQIESGWKIHLTKKGLAEFQAYELGRKGINPPRKWDQRWRILAFDIPEKRRHVREKIRSFLREVGFVRLQDSVWVHPYECRTVLELLRTRYGVRSEALYARVDSLDHDGWLRQHYGLKNV